MLIRSLIRYDIDDSMDSIFDILHLLAGNEKTS